jgi:hypothetical protein
MFIDEILRDLDFCYAYRDNILIASTSEDEHEQHLRIMFQRFSEYGVLLKPAKCVFWRDGIDFPRLHIFS